MFGDFRSIKIIHRIHSFYSKYKKKNTKIKIIFCVPNTLIHFFSQKLKSQFISIGAQNCHYQNNFGPFTGSVNPFMLKNAGAKYVILGHSENRFEGETNSLIRNKIKSALNQNLTVILCIGESLKEKKRGKTYYILSQQIKNCISAQFNLNKIIIAYEPIWSIGSGKILKKNELKQTFIFIKNKIKKIFKTKNLPRILYGGSVNDRNISMFSSISEIDGFLIGGASQSPKKFIDIIKNYYK